MNKYLLFILILLPFSSFGDLYDDAMKDEAKGDLISYSKTLNLYFTKNINDINQDSIIEKLIYSSTLYFSLDETVDFLKFYVKYMENRQSRFRIYKKIAEIYELTGQIQNAGIYYEKAAYVTDDYIDYRSLLNSIDMLIELGYLQLSISKLLGIQLEIGKEFQDRLNSMLCRIYNLTGNVSESKKYLLKINKDYYCYKYLKYELFFENSYSDDKTINSKIINNGYLKLKNPTDYIGSISELKTIPIVLERNKTEYEIFVGTFSNKTDAAGIINIVEQMKLTWFFDNIPDGSWELYIFSEDKNDSIIKLKKLGIQIEE